MTEANRLERAPTAKTAMLIRRPVTEVFAAFTDPEKLSKFWLAHASGKLEKGARVRWDFIVRGAHADVDVREFTPNERIVIAWTGGDTVLFQFSPHGAGQTLVSIENAGFMGSADEVVARAVESACGFTIVLCELKAFLEHDLLMNFGPDKFPDTPLAVERRPAGRASPST